jgi:Domain of unknown function (DUF4169)
MMAEIVNLRTVRKQVERDEKSKRAASNRVKFGRTKAEKQKADAEVRLSERSLDAHKRDV